MQSDAGKKVLIQNLPETERLALVVAADAEASEKAGIKGIKSLFPVEDDPISPADLRRRRDIARIYALALPQLKAEIASVGKTPKSKVRKAELQMVLMNHHGYSLI
mmetsp:Transcript_632/g.1807  ORF Transcript_632/g.1807 Transcript_632/m.1807 type:complete len:106 (-) Transcript_632:102-419(-)